MICNKQLYKPKTPDTRNIQPDGIHSLKMSWSFGSVRSKIMSLNLSRRLNIEPCELYMNFFGSRELLKLILLHSMLLTKVLLKLLQIWYIMNAQNTLKLIAIISEMHVHVVLSNFLMLIHNFNNWAFCKSFDAATKQVS